MDGNVKAAIIAATVAAITGIINIVITINKNHQEGITLFRMNWINNVRDEYTKILGWTWYSHNSSGEIIINDITELSNSINKVSLYLNVADEYDKKVFNKTNEYFDIINHYYRDLKLDEQNNSISSGFEFVDECNRELEPVKAELKKLIRVYLKAEWTRVKYESSIFKFGYWKFIKFPSFKFNSKKVIDKYYKEYID